ncbi:hypothetical protein Xmau_02833 [Xenorhabdus mauleonii]|uniref:Uncharacterized protein n=1 Tax=Xenorhabdus mauleonii TaxID=351675 RepID=A0A1I3IFY6_9GAMM|nr:hypothetical protein [Xenorhabdus mauleonii]PHM39485.1 hypothetical protein Xmau_02833 [Xenorhabdus mauleonii]SFI46841.1 hypothetical protein SAMN05421680_101329 [Xenorhabdus mauleonii]
MPRVLQYVRNKTGYKIDVKITDTKGKDLLNTRLVIEEAMRFYIDLSDNIHDFNHMEKLYVKLNTGHDIYTSLYLANKVGMGLDYFFNDISHEMILISFDINFSCFSLAKINS